MYFNKLKLPRSVIKPQQIMLKSYTGDKINVLGTCWLDCIINNNKNNIQFFVSQSKAQAILGLSTCIDLNLIKRVETVVRDISTPSEILSEFSDLFNGIGCIKYSYHMILKENAQPVISPIRRVPLSLINKLKESIDDLVEKKIIAKVEGPSDWVHPLVLVKKPNGQLRICLDPKHLNAALKREHCILQPP